MSEWTKLYGNEYSISVQQHLRKREKIQKDKHANNTRKQIDKKILSHESSSSVKPLKKGEKSWPSFSAGISTYCINTEHLQAFLTMKLNKGAGRRALAKGLMINSQLKGFQHCLSAGNLTAVSQSGTLSTSSAKDLSVGFWQRGSYVISFDKGPKQRIWLSV